MLKKNSAPGDEQEPVSFESAMERLETIVEQMENSKLPLEELLVRYEEGTKLARICSEKLEAAEKRIEIITRNASGKPQVTEFEPAPQAKQLSKEKDDDISLF